MKEGFVQVYTGNGKGKTTAAIGLAIRAIGHNLKVAMVQFLKGKTIYGELIALGKFKENFYIEQYGREDFVDPNNILPIDIEEANKALLKSKELINSGYYDIVILDEVNVAIYFNLIRLHDLIEIIENKPKSVEVVITGRYAPKELIEIADLVTIMEEKKHYYNIGIFAREGIEY